MGTVTDQHDSSPRYKDVRHQPGVVVGLANVEATELLGSVLADVLGGSGLVFLVGELGAGKTTLVRGLLRRQGFTGSTKSPTYTLVEPYELESFRVYHFDLYRLADPEELEYIGIDEYLTDSEALSIIEWPEKGGDWLPEPHILVELRYDGEARQATVFAKDEALRSHVESLSSTLEKR